MLLFLHVCKGLSMCMREQKIYMQICVYPRLHKHMFSCNYQDFVVVRECVCVCHPSFEDHKYGRGSRQARCLFSVAVDNASEVVTFSHPSIHPSLPSSIHLSVPLCLKKGHHGLYSRQQSDLMKPEGSLTHPPPQKKIFFLCHYSSTC